MSTGVVKVKSGALGTSARKMRDWRNGWGKTNKVGLGGVGEVHVLAGRGRKFSRMVGEEVGRCYYWKTCTG